MNKDFDGWNNYKKLIEKRDYLLKFHEGEIWNCYIGENIGCEECGKNDFLRPIFVLRKISKKGFIGIPMSTKMQKIDDWFIEVTTLDECDHKKEYVLLTQIRFYDAKRLAYKKIKLSKEQIKRIRSRVGILLGILRKINSPNEKVRGDWSD